VSPPPEALDDLDPFDLPEWLGEGEVTWTSKTGLLTAHLVSGVLCGAAGQESPCDLLAVDQAFPAAVVDDADRTRAHQAWRHGQVLLVCRGERPALAVPGCAFTADLVLEALTRLARAVGAEPARFSARLRLGSDG
jgi:hypothetical protein